MTTITAKIIADSVANDIRITTMELEFPRFILPQFNTHRMFSRNAASSRAIPITRNIEAVQSKPALPIHWGKNQAGMQAKEEEVRSVLRPFVNGYGEETEEYVAPRYVWLECSEHAADYAKVLNDGGLHKQIVNRLLEPFLHTKVVVTSTEWDNFFKLRLHDDAQPEIQELAKQMKKAMDSSQPKELNQGEWHTPYVDAIVTTEAILKLSVARCARVSYNNHDGSSPDIAKDLELYDKLLKAGHMSPFEHCASPMDYGDWVYGQTHVDREGTRWSNNLREWVQHRAMIDG